MPITQYTHFTVFLLMAAFPRTGSPDSKYCSDLRETNEVRGAVFTANYVCFTEAKACFPHTLPGPSRLPG